MKAQKSWNCELSGGHLVQEIETILDLYLLHGPSYKVQTAFNALAAREPKFGRIVLRLRARPIAKKGAHARIGRMVDRLTSEEKERIAHIRQSGTEEEVMNSLSSMLPSDSRDKILASFPFQLFAPQNLLFDLWLVLLNPHAAGALRRCKNSACRMFFIAWPRK